MSNPNHAIIDDIVKLEDKRKKELLRVVDNYARFPNADIVAGLKQTLFEKIPKTEDELIFVAFMFGSVSGTQMTVDNMSMFEEIMKGLTPQQLKAMTQAVSKDIDKSLE